MAPGGYVSHILLPLSIEWLHLEVTITDTLFTDANLWKHMLPKLKGYGN